MGKRVLIERTVSVDDVYRFADRAGFLLEQMGDRRGGKAATDLWTRAETRTRLHLVDDAIIESRYLYVEGEGIHAVVQLAHESLATVTNAKALAAFDVAASAAKVGALYDLGVAAARGGKFDARIIQSPQVHPRLRRSAEFVTK